MRFIVTTFFTSDTHFGHANIIKYCNRPFFSVGEMDEALIANWNSVVKNGDTVWHLGDFTMYGTEQAERYRNRLNGDIHLIWGNHDRNAVRDMTIWKSSQYACEISHSGCKITLCHYAMRVWNKCRRGALMFYGHSHNGLAGSSQSLDVGVDAWHYKPVTLPQILQRISKLPKFSSDDHHTVDM